MSKRVSNFMVDTEVWDEFLTIVRDNDIKNPENFLKSFFLFLVQGTEGKDTRKWDIYELLRWAIKQYKNKDPNMVYLIEEGKKYISDFIHKLLSLFEKYSSTVLNEFFFYVFLSIVIIFHHLEIQITENCH